MIREEFIRSKEAAIILGITVNILRKWRVNKKYLPFYSYGNCIIYRKADVLKLKEESLNMPAS